jgi:hypothetical protein
MGVKLRFEHFRGQQVGVDASHRVTRDFGEEVGFAAFAPGAGAGRSMRGSLAIQKLERPFHS